MQTRSSLLLPVVLAVCAALPLLAGCDGARRSVAEAIRPASAAEVAGALRERIAKGEFSQASSEGAAWLANKTDPSGAVAWETAKASAQAGKVDEAIRFAGMAVQGEVVESVRLMSEPLLEPVRSDARLVALAAGVAPTALMAPTAAATEPAAAPAAHEPASASIGAGGIKASAGDVSVELPD